MSEVTLEASGLDQIEQLVTGLYRLPVRFESDQHDPSFTVTQTAVGPIVVGRMFYDMALSMDVEPLGGIGIVHSRNGLAQYRSRGEERRWRPGEVFVSANPADPFTSALDHLDCDFTILDPGLLNDVAHPVPGDASPVRLTDYTPFSDSAAQRWKAAFEYVRNTVAQPELSSLVLGSVSRLLAATTLATFPSNAALDPTIEDRHDAHPPTVQRAIAFIETQPDHDLTVVDIARAAYVTPRALQIAFRRHLDTTPMAYLRRVRLDHAHRNLVAASPGDGTTVTDVAVRWGFTPSRFSAAYHEMYGEKPNETLRR